MQPAPPGPNRPGRLMALALWATVLAVAGVAAAERLGLIQLASDEAYTCSVQVRFCEPLDAEPEERVTEGQSGGGSLVSEPDPAQDEHAGGAGKGEKKGKKGSKGGKGKGRAGGKGAKGEKGESGDQGKKDGGKKDQGKKDGHSGEEGEGPGADEEAEHGDGGSSEEPGAPQEGGKGPGKGGDKEKDALTALVDSILGAHQG